MLATRCTPMIHTRCCHLADEQHRRARSTDVHRLAPPVELGLSFGELLDAVHELGDASTGRARLRPVAVGRQADGYHGRPVGGGAHVLWYVWYVSVEFCGIYPLNVAVCIRWMLWCLSVEWYDVFIRWMLWYLYPLNFGCDIYPLNVVICIHWWLNVERDSLDAIGQNVRRDSLHTVGGEMLDVRRGTGDVDPFRTAQHLSAVGVTANFMGQMCPIFRLSGQRV